jgi:erythromycin esterase-like protein
MAQDNRLQVRAIRENTHALMGLIGDSRFVLLGEASHGTHDFYHTGAQITERLIKEKGFSAVAVEADWPDAYRVHRFDLKSTTKRKKDLLEVSSYVLR